MRMVIGIVWLLVGVLGRVFRTIGGDNGGRGEAGFEGGGCGLVQARLVS